MTLLVLSLTVFMGCVTTEKTVIYKPVLPPAPVVSDPGRPVANGDETDELEIIIAQAQTIEMYTLWADSVMKQINGLGE